MHKIQILLLFILLLIFLKKVLDFLSGMWYYTIRKGKGKKKKKEVTKMYTVYYVVENYWGNEIDELNKKYNTIEEAKRDAEKEFKEWDEDWWIEDENGNVVEG